MDRIVKSLLTSAVLLMLFPYAVSAAEREEDISFYENVQTYSSGDALLEDGETGVWYVYTNGEINYGYNGLFENPYGWWYIRDGSIDWNYSGLVENAYGWWYVRNGSIDWNYSGLVENAYGWWYVRNGSLDLNYTGLVENAYGWWYVNGGSINWGYTGVVENAYGWWYVRNGSIDWAYNGTVQYNGGNCPVVNGSVQQNISWVENMDVAENCSQLIMVSVYNKNYATVSMHLKNENHWNEVFSADGRIGSAGIGKTVEGDKKTPTGVYRLHTAFGIKSDPGCPLGYTKVNENHYWGGEPAKYYNKFVDASKVSDYRPDGGEHIIDYGAVYNYCVAVDYNPECIVGKGSAIFLHCKGKGATAGCISIPEKNMITVLQNLRGDAKIVIDSAENIMNY